MMPDPEFLADLPNFSPIQISPIICYDFLWYTVSANHINLQESDKSLLSDSSVRTSFNPFSEIVNGYQYETMPI